MAEVQNRKTDTDFRNSPTAWFVTLERARASRDFELVARSIQELRRLGVRVRFTRTRGSGVRA